MSLADTYQEYKLLNDSFIMYLDKIIDEDFKGYDEQDVTCKLIAVKENFEKLKEQSDKEEEVPGDKNLGDLKYLIVDGLFLSIDLLNFYRAKEIERFKMRAVNYIRKGRLTEHFKFNDSCSLK